MAASRGMTKNVHILLEAGANPDLQNQVQCVQIRLEAGANPDLQNQILTD